MIKGPSGRPKAALGKPTLHSVGSRVEISRAESDRRLLGLLFGHDLFPQFGLQRVEVGCPKVFHRRRILGDLVSLAPRVGIGKRLLHDRGVLLGHAQKTRLHVVEVGVFLAGEHFGQIERRIERRLLNDLAAEVLLPALLVLPEGGRCCRLLLRLLKGSNLLLQGLHLCPEFFALLLGSLPTLALANGGGVVERLFLGWRWRRAFFALRSKTTVSVAGLFGHLGFRLRLFSHFRFDHFARFVE
jgi:hypothetical protein